MPVSFHQKFKKKKSFFHETTFIASKKPKSKVFFFCCMPAESISMYPAPLCPLPFIFALAGSTAPRTALPRPFPHDCRNYKTWLTPIFIFISTPSNHTRISWHSSISVSAIRTHMWGRECLTCM